MEKQKAQTAYEQGVTTKKVPELDAHSRKLLKLRHDVEHAEKERNAQSLLDQEKEAYRKKRADERAANLAELEVQLRKDLKMGKDNGAKKGTVSLQPLAPGKGASSVASASVASKSVASAASQLDKKEDEQHEDDDDYSLNSVSGDVEVKSKACTIQ